MKRKRREMLWVFAGQVYVSQSCPQLCRNSTRTANETRCLHAYLFQVINIQNTCRYTNKDKYALSSSLQVCQTFTLWVSSSCRVCVQRQCVLNRITRPYLRNVCTFIHTLLGPIKSDEIQDYIQYTYVYTFHPRSFSL